MFLVILFLFVFLSSSCLVCRRLSLYPKAILLRRCPWRTLTWHRWGTHVAHTPSHRDSQLSHASSVLNGRHIHDSSHLTLLPPARRGYSQNAELPLILMEKGSSNGEVGGDVARPTRRSASSDRLECYSFCFLLPTTLSEHPFRTSHLGHSGYRHPTHRLVSSYRSTA